MIARVAAFAASAGLLVSLSAHAGAAVVRLFDAPRSGSQLVYVGGVQSYGVTVYRAGAMDPGVVRNYAVQGAGGVAVDGRGGVYAVDGVVGAVNEYRPGRTKPYLTLTDGLVVPNALAVDSHDTLYVDDVANGIVEYPRGSTSPSKTIGGSDATGWNTLAIDAHDNLFIANAKNAVYEIRSGTATLEPVHLNGLGPLSGIAFDARGLLYLSNPGGIYVYRRGTRDPIRVMLTSFYPGPLVFDSAGLMYVVDEDANLVHIFNAKRAEIGTISKGLVGPGSIAIGP
jgi:hypothetical protein